MNLLQQYSQGVAEGHISHDPDQLAVIQHLDTLRHQLCQMPVDTGAGVLGRLFRNGPPPSCRGIYLWGGVGRGKTWLMDMFYESLPFKHKLRLHFHHFMQHIHDELEQLRGTKNPLNQVAINLARQTRVLCLDEFFVQDITDAMILHNLLEALLRQGMTLVYTSNLEPDELYKNGLQRQRFLPAIELIKNSSMVVRLEGVNDHRLNKLIKTNVWYTPVNTASEQAMSRAFDDLAPGRDSHDRVLTINHREITSLRCVDDIAWFEFRELCIGPRSNADYIELARCYHTILLSGIPIMREEQEEWAHRFINMVDEFYDRRVKLIASAEAVPEHLYQGTRKNFEFRRTISRLLEMRSEDYLAQAHRP